VSLPTDVLDLTALDGLSFVDEDGSLLAEVVRLYHTDSGALVVQTRTAWQQGDLAGLRTAAHTFKSSSGYVGADRVVAHARAIEHLARTEGVCCPEADLAVLEVAYRDACSALMTHRRSRRAASAPAGHPDPATGTAR
jgi:HPt (histidine-containing phosphotransfer) domain-containing protein